MSGICGLVNLDGAPVANADLCRLTTALARRGPDGSEVCKLGSAGLGFTLLATTRELIAEPQPHFHRDSGCVIVADARIDNRRQILDELGPTCQDDCTGDAGLLLAAYLAWGDACVKRILGDFAFAIWDPRHRELFCARDHLGMRQLAYYHRPDRLFAFATEPEAIVGLEQVPKNINEGRIADFLVSQLEGIDKTSTFYADVYRLPPGHTLRVSPRRFQVQRYWQVEPVAALRLSSNEEYAEAFREVFSQAVACRLRSPRPVGSMLSGGMDSGSVAATARQLLAASGHEPLATFSATGPNPENCVETRTILAAASIDGITPHFVNYEALAHLAPRLRKMGWELAEPFDCDMSMVRALYLTAANQGYKVMLDGVAGDVVLNYAGSHLARALKNMRWLAAWRQARGQLRFYGIERAPWRELYAAARTGFAPSAIRRLWRHHAKARGTRLTGVYRHTLISPAFAERIRLQERLDALTRHRPVNGAVSAAEEQRLAIDHPYLTVGRERYDRVAAACGIEPRDPFMDLRVVKFCQSLPEHQKLDAEGWPKPVLRHAMRGHLPESVCWRRGKEHLGGWFTGKIMSPDVAAINTSGSSMWREIEPFIDIPALAQAITRPSVADDHSVYQALHLLAWLKRR